MYTVSRAVRDRQASLELGEVVGEPEGGQTTSGQAVSVVVVVVVVVGGIVVRRRLQHTLGHLVPLGTSSDKSVVQGRRSV